MACVKLHNNAQWLTELLQKTGGQDSGTWYIKDGLCYLGYTRKRKINRDPAFDRFAKALDKSTNRLL